MPALSDIQIDKLLTTIQDRYLAFIVEIAGPKSIRPEELARLQKLGLVKRNPLSLVRQAYEFGTLAAAMSEPDLAMLNYDHFSQQLLQGNGVPLTYEEKSAVRHLERSVAGRVKGLGNKLSQGTNQIIVEADQKLRRRLAGRVKKEMIAGVEHRKTVSQIASNLARATGDQARDWTRIAATELHNAFLEGRADHIVATNKGRDPLVFKRPRPDACPRCISFYLEADLLTPKVFHMSELVANGTTNEGRKVQQWLPTLGCVHPFCQCTLSELPDGFGFDSSGNMVYQGIP